ncbi:hypothetical protein ACJX0J_041645, partial [Zea mays]
MDLLSNGTSFEEAVKPRKWLHPTDWGRRARCRLRSGPHEVNSEARMATTMTPTTSSPWTPKGSRGLLWAQGSGLCLDLVISCSHHLLFCVERHRGVPPRLHDFPCLLQFPSCLVSLRTVSTSRSILFRYELHSLAYGCYGNASECQETMYHEPAKKAAAKPLGAVAKNGLKTGKQETSSNETSSNDESDDDVKPAAPLKKTSVAVAQKKKGDSSESDSDDDSDERVEFLSYCPGSWFLSVVSMGNKGFVGDSLNCNMFASLVCMLRGVNGEVRKWRHAGADRGFTFLCYNLIVAYHRTNLLVRYGRWSRNPNGGPLESLGYKQGYRADVDIPDQTWVEACSFHDVLIFNTGH